LATRRRQRARRRLPPTERLHPTAQGLERLPTARLVAALHRGDAEASRAVGRALPALARLADAAARALGSGGRLVYLGAGTSGRLAALDAAECPPTFGVPPSRVVALVAGGARALRRSVEGAEDDAPAGAAAVLRARVGPGDLAVGVTASGTTRFVLSGLAEARRRGAATALLTCNPAARAAAGTLRAVLATGPERVAGSTRMKAGSATKMALTLVSTAAMIRLGKVREGRMIDVAASNEKLRGRAVRIVAELAGLAAPAAREALAASGWSVRAALERAGAGARAAPAAGAGAPRRRRSSP
jgi:N-acetylmuramic acid 6-phosphate etherase